MSELYHAYILHRRSFRDSSWIIDFFTLESGKLSAVAKGAKSPKSKLRSALQFFSPLVLSFYGRSELLGLKSVEADQTVNIIEGPYLMSLLYVNELLSKLLHKHDPHPTIFAYYAELVKKFVLKQPIEPNLRLFEMQLLADLGYELRFNCDDDKAYTFCMNDGLKPANQSTHNTFKGYALKQIEQREFTDTMVLSTAKRLFRDIFVSLLGQKKIYSTS